MADGGCQAEAGHPASAKNKITKSDKTNWIKSLILMVSCYSIIAAY
jgi:hypothetical protein